MARVVVTRPDRPRCTRTSRRLRLAHPSAGQRLLGDLRGAGRYAADRPEHLRIERVIPHPERDNASADRRYVLVAFGGLAYTGRASPAPLPSCPPRRRCWAWRWCSCCSPTAAGTRPPTFRPSCAAAGVDPEGALAAIAVITGCTWCSWRRSTSAGFRRTQSQPRAGRRGGGARLRPSGRHYRDRRVPVVLASSNATMIVGARSNYALGLDWPIVSFMSRWDRKRTCRWLPSWCRRDHAGAVAFRVRAEPVRTIVEFTAPVFWFFFLLTGISLFVLRKKYAHVRVRTRPTASRRQATCSACCDCAYQAAQNRKPQVRQKSRSRG